MSTASVQGASRSLSVSLAGPNSSNVLAQGNLEIPAGTDESMIRTAISRIHSYSGSHHIGGYHVRLSIVDTPVPATAPPSTSELDNKQKDEVIELAKQESKDKDAVIEDLRAQIANLKKQMDGKAFDMESPHETPKKSSKKVSTGKSKLAAKNSKAKASKKTKSK